MRRTDREVTDFTEIKTILDLCKTCHVAMVDNGEPYIVPLSYGYELNGNVLTLYFHSAKEGRKLEIFRRNKRVCFEVCREGDLFQSDIPCNCGYCFSSIIGYGEIVFLEDTEEKSRALTALLAHQTGRKAEFSSEQTGSVCIYKIISTEYSGKQRPKSTK